MQVEVRSASSDSAVVGARVRAFVRNGDKVYAADVCLTDGEGIANLHGIPDGDAWVVADAHGLARRSAHIAGGDTRIRLTLGEEHSFVVNVTDEHSTAIDGAEVEVVGAVDPMPFGVRTAQDGRIRVGGLGEGPWRVSARMPGYEDKSAPAVRDGESVFLTLQRLCSLSVRAVDDFDKPVAGAWVAVAGGTLWPARVVETDSEGRTTIHGLHAGIFAIRASFRDLVSPTEIGVEVARERSSEIVLKLTRGRSVIVRVTDGDDEDASPIAGARVTLAERGLTPFPLESVTDRRGIARLGPVAVGLATVSAQADGFVSRGAIPVADAVSPEMRVALFRPGTLTGRVTDSRGFPIDGATIEVVGSDTNGGPLRLDPQRSNFQVAHFERMLTGPSALTAAGQLGVLPGPVPPIPGGPAVSLVPEMNARSLHEKVSPWSSKSDGTFSVHPAPPGNLRLVVHHPQYVDKESPFVTLRPGEEVQVNVVMLEGGELQGRVLDARQRPVEGARIHVAATRGFIERTTYAGGDGTFAFVALPSVIELTAGTDDDPALVRFQVSIPNGGRREVNVQLPEERDPVDIEVLDERGSPIQSARVNLTSLAVDTPMRATGYTDERGHTTAKHACGLPIRLEASASGHASQILTWDEAPRDVVVTMGLSPHVTGSVVSARDHEPVLRAEVSLTAPAGVFRTQTSGYGVYEFDGVGPGAATLRVRAKGFAAITADVSIPEWNRNRDSELPRVELVPEGTIEGVVSDSSGAPVAGARVAENQAPTWVLSGATPPGVVLADSRGRFSIGQLAEGSVTLEAYAPGLGRGRSEPVVVESGRTTEGVKIALVGSSRDDPMAEPPASGSLAVTLGETADPVDVVVTSVVEGSYAERAGVRVGDVVEDVDGTPVQTMGDARERMSGPVSDDVILRVRRSTLSVTLRVPREQVRR